MKRLLLVEDNRADARLFEELVSELPGRPFQITHAETLAQAKALVVEHDIVFLDLSLPDGRGVDTVTAMAAVANHVPIIVLTGTDDDRTWRDAMKAGAQDYLTKAEITPGLVERTVRYALERKRAEEDAQRLAIADETARTSSFLSAVSHEISASLDLEATLPRVTSLLVPTLGDYCILDLAREGGGIVRVAHAAADPAREETLGELRGYIPGQNHSRSPVGRVLATGAAILLEHFDAAAFAPDQRYLQICSALEPRAMYVVPLVARGRVVGAVTLAMGPSGRSFAESTRQLAQQVAERIALGIDNAQLYATAQRAIRGRDELLAIVSHDLRNPLNVLDLTLNMIEEQPEMVPNALPRAKRAVDSMLRLIEDLLEISQIESGTLAVEPQPIPAHVLLEDAYEHHRVLAQNRGLTLEIAGSTTQAVCADRKRVGQVLANLIGNAIKFTPRGGKILIGARADADAALMTVQDTGRGIPGEHLAHIFDRFWQPERGREGVGLGLAIVKGIVEAHGGTIEVESSVGQGTTFRIRLPHVAAAAA